MSLIFSEGFVTKWFIGLVFVKAENVNVDLTFDIQSFTDIGWLDVHRAFTLYSLCEDYKESHRLFSPFCSRTNFAPV